MVPSTIMKQGVSWQVSAATGTAASITLSPGCRFVRIVANNPCRYVITSAAGAPTYAAMSTLTNGAAIGLYMPGQTFGPDYADTSGLTTVTVAANQGSNVALWITELSS